MLERAQDVQEVYEASRGVRVKLARVRSVMRDLLDMSFSVLIKTAPTANSERCRVQRQ